MILDGQVGPRYSAHTGSNHSTSGCSSDSPFKDSLAPDSSSLSSAKTLSFLPFSSGFPLTFYLSSTFCFLLLTMPYAQASTQYVRRLLSFPLACSLILPLIPSGSFHTLPLAWALTLLSPSPSLQLFFPLSSPTWSVQSGRALAHFGLALVPPLHGPSSPLLESANHPSSVSRQIGLSSPQPGFHYLCRNEAIFLGARLPVRMAAGIINEDKVPAA